MGLTCEACLGCSETSPRPPVRILEFLERPSWIQGHVLQLVSTLYQFAEAMFWGSLLGQPLGAGGQAGCPCHTAAGPDRPGYAPSSGCIFSVTSPGTEFISVWKQQMLVYGFCMLPLY